jgi:hypothetical protein
MFKLSSTIYYDRIHEEYVRILCLNKPPTGPLSSKVFHLRRNKLTESQPYDECDRCIFVIKSDLYSGYSGCKKYMYIPLDDIDILFDYLIHNGYEIEKTFTKISQKNTRLNKNDDFICYITYNP